MKPIRDIRAALQAKAISREDFWRAMQEWHLALRQYQELAAAPELRQIEIDADELRVVTDRGVRMAWHPEDLRTAPNVLVNTGEYEPVESAALLRGAVGAQVIFDIGANVGFYALNWAQELAPGGSIHVFEPVPTTYERLVRNIALNGLEDHIRANNMGVGDEIAKLTIYLPEFSGSGAASIKDLHPDETSIQVEADVTTLDIYFANAGLDRLDMMKVDVEGAELMVLKGGMNTLGAHKPLLFLELLRKWSKPFGYHPNDVLNLLAGLGYRCYTHESDRLVRFDRMSDETVQTNFFFADPEKHGAWLAANGVG